MVQIWIATGFALFVWWFSTGAILVAVRAADQQGHRARRAVVLAGLPLLGLGAWGYAATLDATTAAASAYAFLSAVAVWGWIELSFLAGIVTGPVHSTCPPQAPIWERFLRAWGTISYHEIVLAVVLCVLWVISQDAANTFGFWTFAILYFARLSAKLNLFLGVPKVNTEFLPAALSHLPSHFRLAPLNWLFPVSVTVLSMATACWLERLVTAQTPFETTGFTLLTAITALALLEHWLMVLPLPDAKLWRWMLPAPQPAKKPIGPEDAPHGL